MKKEEIRERAKGLCSDLFNVLTLYHQGSCTEFAEAKAVETAEGIIVDIQKLLIEKACEFLEKTLPSYTDIIGDIIDRDVLIELFRETMEK